MTRKKCKKVYLVAIIAATLPVILFITTSSRSDPTVDGRRLSEWLKAAEPSTPLSLFTPTSPEAIEAIAAIQTYGTNAAPGLLEWVASRDSKLRSWLNRQLTTLSKSRISLTPAAERNTLGLRGLAMLGADALPFLPALHQSLDQSNSVLQAQYSSCLAGILTDLAPGAPVLASWKSVPAGLRWPVGWTFQRLGQSWIAAADDPNGGHLILFLLKDQQLLDLAVLGRSPDVGTLKWKLSQSTKDQAPMIEVFRTVGPWDWGATLWHRQTNYVWREIGWRRPPPEESPKNRQARTGALSEKLHPPIGLAIRDSRFEIELGSNVLELTKQRL